MPRRLLCPLLLLFLFGFHAPAQTTLNGAGSTFVYPLLTKWAEQYHKQHPEVQISYLPNGSGAGIAQTMAGMIDFGGTNAPVSDAELAKAKIRIIHDFDLLVRRRVGYQAHRLWPATAASSAA